MSRECQEKNAKPLTMVAVGVNKAAEQYMILDEHTKEELASGKYHDQRRGFFGTPARSPAPENAPANPPAGVTGETPGETPGKVTGQTPGKVTGQTPGKVTGEAALPRPASRVQPPRNTVSKPVRHPWSRSQQKLALLYNEQGLRPAEIAAKLGLSTYIVTQIILNARSRGKL